MSTHSFNKRGKASFGFLQITSAEQLTAPSSTPRALGDFRAEFLSSSIMHVPAKPYFPSPLQGQVWLSLLQGDPNQQNPINFVMLPWKIQCTASTVEKPMRGKRGQGNDCIHVLQWRVSEGEKGQNSSLFSKFTGSCECQQNQLTPLKQAKDTFSGTGSWRSPCYAAGWISRRAQQWIQPSSANSTKVKGRAFLRFRHVSKKCTFHNPMAIMTS